MCIRLLYWRRDSRGASNADENRYSLPPTDFVAVRRPNINIAQEQNLQSLHTELEEKEATRQKDKAIKKMFQKVRPASLG